MSLKNSPDGIIIKSKFCKTVVRQNLSKMLVVLTSKSSTNVPLFQTHFQKSFSDYLRVWRAGEPETRLECLLNNNKNSDFCAPLTSFDWNEVDPNLLGTSSIDTTCTIW